MSGNESVQLGLSGPAISLESRRGEVKCGEVVAKAKGFEGKPRLAKLRAAQTCAHQAQAHATVANQAPPIPRAIT
jgi:hypothetical protein